MALYFNWEAEYECFQKLLQGCDLKSLEPETRDTQWFSQGRDPHPKDLLLDATARRDLGNAGDPLGWLMKKSEITNFLSF